MKTLTDDIDKLIESISEEYGNPKKNKQPSSFLNGQLRQIASEKQRKNRTSRKKMKLEAKPLISTNSTQRKTIQRKKQNKIKQPKSKGLIILSNLLFYSLIIAVLATSVLFAVSSNRDKSYFGYRLYNVRTDSMVSKDGAHTDGFASGDIILVETMDAEQVKVGDVITFYPSRDRGSFLTHRVVETREELNGEQGIFFVTKGDANEVDDPPFSGDQLVGKKIAVIPKVGVFLSFMQENLIVTLVLIGSLLGFVSALKFYFSK